MAKIRNVHLEFSCRQERERLKKVKGGYRCGDCAQTLVDFTDKVANDLEATIAASPDHICGIFTKSQLSKQFLKYAAAAVIVSATAACDNSDKQKVNQKVSVTQKQEELDDVVFGGIVIDQPAPHGGMEHLFEEIGKLLVYPEGLDKEGKVYVQYVVDSTGVISDYKVVKSFHPLATKEALKVFSELKVKWIPAKNRGVPVSQRMILPITFRK